MENRIAEILWHGYTESRICDRIRPASLALLILKGEISISLPVEAITRKQERELLKFIKEDKHFCRYYDAIYVLFNTGLRISEFCGLTFSDLEFDQNAYQGRPSASVDIADAVCDSGTQDRKRLNVYTHVQFDDAQAELLRVAEV